MNIPKKVNQHTIKIHRNKCRKRNKKYFEFLVRDQENNKKVSLCKRMFQVALKANVKENKIMGQKNKKKIKKQ